MTDKELEIIKKINEIQNSIKPIEENIKTIQSIQKNICHFNKITPLSETLRNVEKFREYLKPIHEANIGLVSIIEKHGRYYQPPLSEIIKKQVELKNRIEKNLLFNSIWRGTPIEDTPENQEKFGTEVEEFASDILELTSYIPDQEIEENIPVDEILEEVNKLSETYITKENLNLIIGFLFVSVQVSNAEISQKAIYILEALGKFSKTDLGSGIVFIITIIALLVTLKDHNTKE